MTTDEERDAIRDAVRELLALHTWVTKRFVFDELVYRQLAKPQHWRTHWIRRLRHELQAMVESGELRRSVDLGIAFYTVRS